MADFSNPFLDMVVPQLPFYLVWLVGFIIALLNWPRYPRPALLTVLATGIMFLGSVVYCYLWSQSIRDEWADGVPDRTWLQVITWAHTLSRALGYGLLIWAVFGWRQVVTTRRLDRRRDEEDDFDDDERTGDSDPRIRTRPKRMSD